MIDLHPGVWLKPTWESATGGFCQALDRSRFQIGVEINLGSRHFRCVRAELGIGLLRQRQLKVLHRFDLSLYHAMRVERRAGYLSRQRPKPNNTLGLTEPETALDRAILY